MCDGKNCRLARVVLEVDDAWRHDGYVVDDEERRVTIRVAHVRGRRHACPNCGAANQPVHDAKPRTWRHLYVGDYQCRIEARVPRVKCGECGKVSQVEVPWARPMSRLTRKMEALLVSSSRRSSVRAVAQEHDVSDYRIWHAIKHYVDKAREKADHSGVRIVGIDETSTCKGHRYITVVVDAMTGKTIHAGPGRDREAVDRFAGDLREHGGCPLAIRKACIDMSPAYISGVEEYLPNAAIVHDKFHVVKMANDAVDQVRREEQKIWKAALKKTRFLLLMNREDLSDAGSERMEDLSRNNFKTGRAYENKEKLRTIFSGGLTVEQGEAGLREWLAWAQRSRLEPFVKLGRTIRRHMDGIVAIFDSPGLTNGPSEGINSVIQCAKARARGFRTVENMIAIVYLMTADLEGLPESPYKNIKLSDLEMLG